MSALFNISNKGFFEDNPEARSIPSFLKAGEDAMKYICLFYGYNSPFRLVPVEERKAKVISICDIEKTPTGRPGKLEKALLAMTNGDLRKAVEDFQDIQFDEDRDTHQAYLSYLKQCKDLLRKVDKDPKERDQAFKTAKEFNTTVENEKSLREILEIRNQEEFKVLVDTDDDTISADNELEKFLENID